MFLSLSFRLVVISSLLLIYSWSLCSFNVGKERQGLLVEWVEKVSFVHLNKLFEIDAIERAHSILLSDKNLHVLIKNPKSFIISVFPWLAPPSLVPDKHFVLKDLSFHEVARLADSEARQARLEKREKKR